MPDDDRLLAVALDDEIGLDVGESSRSRASRCPAIDHRDRVRQLVAHALERRLADDLGDAVLDRLVGDHAVRVELRTDRHEPEQLVGQHIELVVGQRRERDDGVPVLAQGVDLEEPFGDLLAGRGIRLRHDRDLLRAAVAAERLGDAAVARTDLLVRGHEEADHVDVAEHLLDEVVEPLAEQRAGLVQPRRVHDHELAGRAVQDAADGAPRRLRLVARDGDLLAHQRVRERRLADVRSSDECHEAGSSLRRAGPRALVGGCCISHPDLPSSRVKRGSRRSSACESRRSSICRSWCRSPAVREPNASSAASSASPRSTNTVASAAPATAGGSPGQHEAVVLRGRAGQRHPPERLAEEAADRVDVFVFELEAEQVADFVEAEPRADAVAAGLELDHLLGARVVFVGDLADQLLDEVLQGDEARHAAVLVDDEAHVHGVALHLLQEALGLHRLRDEHRAPRDPADRGIPPSALVAVSRTARGP